MKIAHCCLANFYIDNYGYQENVLPKMHQLQGHDVSIIASTETYIENKKLGYVEPRVYKTETNIPIARLPYVSWLPKKIVQKLRIYKGLNQILIESKPDLIFLHDTQFISIRTIAKYAKKNPHVRIFADGHTDFVNSARGWISKNILHKILYKHCAHLILPYLKKYYGTLPSRVEFIHDVYGVPKEKIELLELGADDSLFDLSNSQQLRLEKRTELGFTDNDFVMICGGKIDLRKNIHLLIEAFSRISNPNIKLIIFGTPNVEMHYVLKEIEKDKRIIYLGWLNTEDIYKALFASDLGVFPGTHSVLWEEATGVGLPCIFKKWTNITHVDLGGNCLFLDEVSVETIQTRIEELALNRILYNEMKEKASLLGPKRFTYSIIAEKAIVDN